MTFRAAESRLTNPDEIPARNVPALFDLDGVLVDSAGAYRSAWQRWATERNIDESAIWSDAHGKRPEDIITRVAPGHDRGAALAAFDAAFGAAAGECRAMPGARDCLQALRPRTWAIVTSGKNAHVRRCLERCRLPLPEVLVCGDEVSRGKPDPEGFLRAARGLGARPDSCLVIEDAPVGIKAARAAGMETIAITTTHQPSELAAADHIFASLKDVKEHLLARTAGSQ